MYYYTPKTVTIHPGQEKRVSKALKKQTGCIIRVCKPLREGDDSEMGQTYDCSEWNSSKGILHLTPAHLDKYNRAESGSVVPLKFERHHIEENLKHSGGFLPLLAAVLAPVIGGVAGGLIEREIGSSGGNLQFHRQHHHDNDHHDNDHAAAATAADSSMKKYGGGGGGEGLWTQKVNEQLKRGTGSSSSSSSSSPSPPLPALIWYKNTVPTTSTATTRTSSATGGAGAGGGKRNTNRRVIAFSVKPDCPGGSGLFLAPWKGANQRHFHSGQGLYYSPYPRHHGMGAGGAAGGDFLMKLDHKKKLPSQCCTNFSASQRKCIANLLS